MIERAAHPFIKLSKIGDRVHLSGCASYIGEHQLSSATDEMEGIFLNWRWDGNDPVVEIDSYGIFPSFYSTSDTEVRVANALGLDHEAIHPTSSLFSSSAFLDYLLMSDAMVPSLNLFIVHVVASLRSGMGAIWDGLAPEITLARNSAG